MKKVLISTNPGKNYEKIGEISISTSSDVHNAVKKARQAFFEWSKMSVSKRVDILDDVYKALEAKKEDIASLASQEMGMPISLSRNGDIGDGLAYFSWYLHNAEKHLAPETTFEDAISKHVVYHEPIGVAGVIVPWNWPFCNWVWGVVPQLVAGNTVVFKHSEETPLVGKLISDIMGSTKLPKGVFNQVYGDGQVGSEMIGENIDLISFTGSTKVGKFLYETAGRKFIRAILELGGSAPGIVFEDVDIDQVVEAVYLQRFANSGQTCDALKRLMVHSSIYDEVVDKLTKKLAKVVVGHQEDDRTEIGPLVAKRILEILEGQVMDATQKGAKIITPFDASLIRLKGAYAFPTLLTHVTRGMRVWQEEVFGPVLPVVSFETEKEAITLANDTPYGLGAYVYTRDQQRAARVSKDIQSGMVSINGLSYVIPASPFGGYKSSGMGREHGKYGLHEVTQIKVIAYPKQVAPK